MSRKMKLREKVSLLMMLALFTGFLTSTVMFEQMQPGRTYPSATEDENKVVVTLSKQILTLEERLQILDMQLAKQGFVPVDNQSLEEDLMDDIDAGQVLIEKDVPGYHSPENENEDEDDRSTVQVGENQIESSSVENDRVDESFQKTNDDQVEPQVEVETQEEMPKIRVAMYSGPGATVRSKANIPKVLGCDEDKIVLTRLSGKHIHMLTRKYFDVVVFPGGGAARTIQDLRKKAKGVNVTQVLRRFVRNGGGYVGVCAGAFLAGPRLLKLGPVYVDGLRGGGYFSELEIDNTIKETLLWNKSLSAEKFYYANGPIFPSKLRLRAEKDARNARSILRVGSHAHLRIFQNIFKKVPHPYTEKNRRNYNVMIMNDFGKGKVVVSTGHPETDVQKSTYKHLTHDIPPECDSVQARMLLNMIYLAADQNPNDDMKAFKHGPPDVDKPNYSLKSPPLRVSNKKK
mmetsp:Transcript_10687/g.17474  ORF Transcript_10687/g.17474 Transcript_10687/m.17474 type:complete len:459 (-) Transcript_10687:85-1461(-)